MSGRGNRYAIKEDLKISKARFNFQELELLDRLAEIEHEQWVHWTLYFLNNLNVENIERWLKQAKKSYWELSEKEKESDRQWAKKVLAIIRK